MSTVRSVQPGEQEQEEEEFHEDKKENSSIGTHTCRLTDYYDTQQTCPQEKSGGIGFQSLSGSKKNFAGENADFGTNVLLGLSPT